MVSWGNKMTAVINIRAKFRKTFLMNDGSPWLPLNNKYLQGAAFFRIGS
jgi:hypothetical protein